MKLYRAVIGFDDHEWDEKNELRKYFIPQFTVIATSIEPNMNYLECISYDIAIPPKEKLDSKES